MNLRETYNKIAEDWYNEVNANHWWENGLNKFASFFKKNDSILDVGCGPGITAKYFIKNNLNVFGIDFSEKMIEIAKRKVPRGKFSVMDLNDINEINDLFDGIYLQNVLLHIPKKEAEEKLKNIVKLLKKEGYIYISVKEKTPDGPEEYVKVDNDYGYRVERFFSCFTKEEIKKYLHNLSFEILFLNIVQTGKNRWIQFIAKKV